MSDEAEKIGNTPLPKFTGREKDFEVFWPRFEAYAVVKGFVHLLIKEQAELELPEGYSDFSADADTAKKQKQALKLNDRAMAAFTLAFTDAVHMNYIHSSKDNEGFPYGLAYLVTEKLMKRYRPMDKITEVDAKTDLRRVKMSKSDTPDDFINKFLSLKSRYHNVKGALTESELVTEAMVKAKTEYKTLITTLMITHGDNLNLEHMRDGMTQQYRMNHSKGTDDGPSDDSSEEGTEAIMSSFDGECYNCGKKGHKATDCRQSKKSFGMSKGKFKGSCNNCGKPGHKEKDCWKKESNKHKRPKSWKSKSSEAAQSATDDQFDDEIFLMSSEEEASKDKNNENSTSEDVQEEMAELAMILKAMFLKTVEQQEGRKISPDQVEAELAKYAASSREKKKNKVLEDKKIKVKSEQEQDKKSKKKSHQNDEDDEAVCSAVPGSLSELANNEEYWVGDTGCTAHLKKSKKGMTNLKPYDQNMIMGNGSSAKGKEKGTMVGHVVSKDEETLQKVTLTDVIVSSQAKFNLMSLTSLIAKGWELSSTPDALIMKKNGQTIKFDVVIPTRTGKLFCIRIKENEVQEVGAGGTDPKKQAYKLIHAQLGHVGHEDTMKMAKHLGIQVARGDKHPCESCAKAKAKSKGVSKNSPHKKSTIVNGRVYMDLSSIKKPKNNPKIKSLSNPQWRMIVDEKTEMKTSQFFQTKNGMIEPTCELLSKWKSQKHPVKIIRCDNAGENTKLEKRANGADWKLDVQFEYTARDTPQQNYLVEKSFDTLTARGRAMMDTANVPTEHRYKLFREVFKTATLLDGLVVTTIDGKKQSRYEHYYGKLPKFARALRVWGEAGVVKTKKKGESKLQDKGTTCMMAGYSGRHDAGTYRMYDAKTSRILISKDIRWLKRMYFKKASKVGKGDKYGSETAELSDASTTSNTDHEDETSEEEEKEAEPDNDEEAVAEGENPWQTVTRSGRRSAPPTLYVAEPASRSNTAGATMFSYAETNYYNALMNMNDFDDSEVAALAGSDTAEEVACVGAGVGGGFENTSELKVLKYNEAMKNPDKKKWEQAVQEEYERFKKYKVFKPVKKEEVPKDAKILSTTWAMKKKSNGTYRARMNMRGYEQKDGEHFDSSSISSPVTNDVSIRCVLVLMIMAGWYGHMCDVKGAFLHGTFDNGEVIYTTVPQGFEKWYDPEEWLLLLLKTCYGLKQAAMMFWRELLKAMVYMKFCRSNADPCLYWRWTTNGLLIWLSWVDDCVNIGPKEEVMKSKDILISLFDCEDVGEFNEYVGCKLERDQDKGTLTFTQPVLLQSFEDEFNLAEREYEIPAEASSVLQKCSDEVNPTAKDLKTFRSGTGKLLHLMRWSKPEIWNSVRELSRRMTKSNEAHRKAMLRVMKYCITTRKLGWTLKPSRKWNGKDKNFEFIIRGESDSNYATCVETRKSVTGFCVYLEDALISVKSGMQKIVALSVTEAEVIALVQVVQEMMYVMKIIESMELKVKKPMMIQVDNKGTVDLANGWSVGGGTKHMEVRIMYLRELKENNVIKVIWQSTHDNTSDIFTKNLDTKTFVKHRNTLLAMEDENADNE